MVNVPIKKLKDIYPKEWSFREEHLDVLEFRNVQHFKNYVKPLSLRNTTFNMDFDQCLSDLLKNVPVYDVGNYEIIKNRVKNNLLKRGLISESVYESYKYSVEGEIVDVSKVINGDPECFLTPNETYKNYFYELYINFSIGGSTSNEAISEGLCKILATIELLEKEHIYCKITAVDYSKYVSEDDKDLIVILPIFSYKDVKDIKLMSSVLNDRFLRCFSFAISEDMYKEKLSSGYGQAIKLDHTIKPTYIDECELASSIIDKVIVGGKR